MATEILAMITDILVLGVMLIWRGRVTGVYQKHLPRRLMLLALIPMGWYIGIFLIFAIGETFSGDISGIFHLFPAFLAALLTLLTWWRPFLGGMLMTSVGIVALTGYAAASPTAQLDWFVPLLVKSMPFFVSGGLFIAAGAIARREEQGR